MGQYNELEARFDFPDQKTIYFLNGTEFDQDSWADLPESRSQSSAHPTSNWANCMPAEPIILSIIRGYFDDLEISLVPEPGGLGLLASEFLSSHRLHLMATALWQNTATDELTLRASQMKLADEP